MTDTAIFLSSTYNFQLVALSVAIAIVAAYTALDLAGRITESQGWGRRLWLMGGAIALGTGIWAMHFVGMLAYQLSMPMVYDIPLVMVSLLVAVIASSAALFVVGQAQLQQVQLLAGSLLMGLGIASMHYIGMAAMRVSAVAEYRYPLVLLSVAIAIGASLMALILAFWLRKATSQTGFLCKLVSAVVMGSAIVGMHYTAMAAVQFQTLPIAPTALAFGGNQVFLAIGVSVATGLILVLALLASFFDQYLSVRSARAEALRQSERRFRALVQNASDIIAIVSAEGVVSYCSPSVESILNYKPEDWLQQSILEWVHPADRVQVETLLAQARQSPQENMTAELRLRSRAGTWQDFEVIANNLLAEPSVAGIITTYRHITERKRTEAILQDTLQQLNFHFENSPLAVIEWDQDFCVARWSPEAERVFGWQAEEVIGRHVDEWQFVFAEDLDRVRGVVAQLLDGRQQRNVAANRNYTKSGTVLYCEWYNSALLDEAGNLVSVLSLVLDVTARQQLEQALQISENRFRTIIEQSPISIQIFGADGSSLQANQAWEDLWQTSRENLQNYNILQDPLLQAQGMSDRLHKVFAGEALTLPPLLYDPALNHLPGRPRWIEAYLYPVREADQIREVVLMLQDVSDRKQAEEELRRSKDQLEIILRGVADGITVQSTKGLVYANDAAAKLIGYPTAEDLLAASLPEIMQKFEVMDESGRPFPLDRLPGRLAMQGENAQEILLKYRVLPTGEERWSLVKANPILDTQGRVQFAINIFHDITDRKRIEEEQRFLAEASTLLNSSLDYQTTLESLAYLAVPYLADWCAIDVLEADQSIHRVAVAHTDPSKVQWAIELQERYPPNPNTPQGVPQVLRTGQPELYSEISDELLVHGAEDAEHLELLRQVGFKSGMVVPLVARGRTLGAITFVTSESERFYGPKDLAFAEDLARRAALATDNARLFETARQEINERKRAEAALQARADELTQTTTMLARTAAILEKRNQELDQFAYVTSHDLKAPLRAIASLSQWIEEDLTDSLTDDTRHQMNLLRGRVHRMEALIDGILQYSRIGRIKTDTVAVEVESLLAEIIDSLAPPPGFQVIIEPGMPTFVTERLPLRQVFANLIGNALKHHDRPDGRVTISVKDLGRAFEFSVADDGPGIDPQFHEKVFVIFQTLVARDKAENTGIGLALVKKIVDNQGGTIHLESEPGQGSIFRFTWLKHARSNKS